MRRPRDLAPGIVLCAAIGAVSRLIQTAETRWLERPYIESLVVAILVGTAVRTAWEPTARFREGIGFCAREVLEFAVVLLGVSVDSALLAKAGPLLLGGIVLTVAVSLVASYAIGRSFGLNHRLALLVGCGNSICGNSAIAAIAPVIDAEPGDVAAAIAFTAVLGVVVVLTLPMLIPVAGLSERQYGVVAGLTVYAVPQVLAATLPVGAAAANLGTLVKLVRVLMLGPVVLALGFIRHSPAQRAGRPARAFVPWFIIGFFVLALARATGVVPAPVVDSARTWATVLTIAAMAALGLGVDVRTVRNAGPRVVATVIASLALLLGLSLRLATLLPRSL